VLSQWLFLKFLSLAYFFAFVSLHAQVLGLFGSKGIVPIKDLAGQLHKQKMGFLSLPTLFLYRSSDSFLKGTALLGIILSISAFVGFIPFVPLMLLWVIYLSFYTLGYPFLCFQWDALLIEAGFAGIWFAMLAPPPLMLDVWMWVLLFRLMLTSGLVKWFSGCPKWHSLQALRFHFETQPLPNFGGYIAHHISWLCGKFGSYAVFFFEGPAVLLLLGTPEMRLIGGLLQLFFQGMIIATGNYAFFNLLTIALIATVFDEKYLQGVIPYDVSVQALPQGLYLEIPLTIIASCMILMNLILLLRQILQISFFSRAIHLLGRWGILNTYGLFAVMTTTRDEVVIEGTLDGFEWKEYHFKYKPGLLDRGIAQVAPLHPRLDWQMWFIALGNWRDDSWFTAFILRLLEPSEDVLGLLAHDPFGGKSPIAIRAKRYRYHFTTFEEWRKTGNYWTREEAGMFLPEVMHENS
jgi:lipase maturation factor 1